MNSSLRNPDLAIIGAGPAGLGAAIAARSGGLSVVLIDDQLEPGGQIWRAAGSSPLEHAQRMGREYLDGRERVADFLDCGATYLPEHTVWQIEETDEQITVYCSGPDSGETIKPKALLLATGAVERPVPIPGWTLPGVMTGGGLQVLLKSARLSPEGSVLAGAGPLLWLLAAQLVAAGSPPVAVVEGVSLHSHVAAIRHLPSALKDAKPLAKGLSLMAKVTGAGVSVYRNAQDFRVLGDTRVSGFSFKNMFGRTKKIDTEVVGLHCGVVPNPQITRLLRTDHRWSKDQHAFHPVRDREFRVGSNIYVAGDGARIGGAEVAWLEGQIIGTQISGGDTFALRQQARKAEATRPFIDRLYLPDRHLRVPLDDTTICRCEGVTAGRVRQAARDGAAGPNQVKFMLRTGMGPCQGRVCGLALSEVIAETRNQNMADTGYLRIRPPIKPIPVGAVAEASACEPPEST
ncbi:MAG: NAD(P)/FAD-dependent oxidoreductase [Pseudomonadota bacterium]